MVRLRDYEGTSAADEEDLLRWTWWGYMVDIKKELLLPNATVQAAAVYTHRFFEQKTYTFYSENSYERNRMKVVACASLLLTGKHIAHSHSEKIEPVTIENLLPISFRLIYPNCNDEATYQRHHREICEAEEELTLAIGPDFYVDLPHGSLAAGLLTLQTEVDLLPTVNRATEVILHTYVTKICLQYGANQIGAAALQLAAEEKGVPLVSRFQNKQWYEGMACTESEVRDLCAVMREELDQLPIF